MQIILWKNITNLLKDVTIISLKAKTIIRNNEYEKIWTNSTYNKINNIEQNSVQNNHIINENNTSLDHVLYADDAAIEFKKLKDIEKKLHEYNNNSANANFKNKSGQNQNIDRKRYREH